MPQETTNLLLTDFAATLQKLRIPEAKSKFYVHWVKRFGRFLNGLPFVQASPEMVEAFLIDLAADPLIQDWQVEQAKEAVRVLYSDHLKVNMHNSGFRENEGFKDSIAEPDKVEKLHGGMLKKVVSEIRVRHYSIRTEESYLAWIKRFISFNDLKDPRVLDSGDIRKYLDFLASERNVSSATQNLALNSLVFLYKQVLKKDPGEFGDFTRAKASTRIPTVLSRDEIGLLLKNMDGVYKIMAGLFWGSGLRVMECVRLRIQDIDFECCPRACSRTLDTSCIFPTYGVTERRTSGRKRFSICFLTPVRSIRMLRQTCEAGGIPGSTLTTLSGSRRETTPECSD